MRCGRLVPTLWFLLTKVASLSLLLIVVNGCAVSRYESSVHEAITRILIMCGAGKFFDDPTIDIPIFQLKSNNRIRHRCVRDTKL